MKIKVPKRFTASVLSILLSAGMINTGCKNDKLVSNNTEDSKDDKALELVIDETTEEVDFKEHEVEETVTLKVLDDDKEEEIVVSSDVLDYLQQYRVIQANTNVKIREEASSKSKQLGLFIKGNYLNYIEKLENGWYKVEYNDGIAYVSAEYVDYIETYELPCNQDVPFLDQDHDLYDFLDPSDVVVATANVNIRTEPNTDCEKLGLLNKGEALQFISQLDNGWYEVEYNGQTAYVTNKYAKQERGYTQLTEMKDMVYLTQRSPIFNIDTAEEIKQIPKHEVAEVYAQTEDYYLVKSCGSFGFIQKKYCQSLGDTYIIVDISDQTLKMYVDDKLFVYTYVTTGKKSTPTYCGIFDVYKMGTDVYWKEFNVTVKYAMAFNRGANLHSWPGEKKKKKENGEEDNTDFQKQFLTALYYADNKMFGPDIPNDKRSHGCVRTPKVQMQAIYEKSEVGTPVLVKK